jgi:hypothetical protein
MELVQQVDTAHALPEEQGVVAQEWVKGLSQEIKEQTILNSAPARLQISPREVSPDLFIDQRGLVITLDPAEAFIPISLEAAIESLGISYNELTKWLAETFCLLRLGRPIKLD